MKVKLKDKLSRALSLLLAINLILAGVVATDTYYSIDSDIAYAAESTTMGSGSYPAGAAGGATLTAGTTYTLEGCEWMCVETSGNVATIIMTKGNTSKGVMGGYWPNYVKNGNSYNSSSLEDTNIMSDSSIAAYYTGHKKVYDAISPACNDNKGFYLLPYSKVSGQSGYYWTALKTAAANCGSFGASYSYAWLGTVNGSNGAWCVDSGGGVYNDGGQYDSYVVAPAFNLDTSKVSLSGTSLTVATFTDSTGITATQSITSVEEGSTTNLANIITAAYYSGGTNNGKSAQYKVSTSEGSISGTNWTAPTGIKSNKTVTLTITEQNSGHYWSTTKTVTVTPRAAGNIKVTKSGAFPESVKTGSQTNLASYITVTGYDSANQYDGEISSYTMSADIGSFSGTTYTAGTVSRPTTATITVKPTGSIGSVSYASKSTTFTITVNPSITGISATQAVSSVEEGQVIDVNSIITGVQYVGGEADSGYKISITGSSCGTLSGTTWTAPAGLSSNKDVTLTITDSANKYTTTKTVTVTPRAAKFISVEKKQTFPDHVVAKDTVDLAPHILVTGYDSASQSDGTITSYTLSADFGSFNGTKYTAGDTTTAKTATITVTATCSLGSVNYTSKTAAFQIQIKPDTTGWTDREELTPEEQKRFHTYTDSTTGITWHYKYNDNGDILYLYTEDNVAKIISDGKVLLVPSSINGVSVVGIGGGHKDGDIIPFIPSTGGNVNNTWTSIHIPSSVKTINDGAFLGNGASAEIVIPGNVSKIGVQAFKDSKLKSVIFNNADALSIYSEAFADIPTLKSAVIRGNGTTIRTRAFARDTGLTEIEIPYGTKFKGNTDNDDSYAFLDTTGLTTIKIDTEIVEGNIFSGNKNLAKVIFGENVKRVRYDWVGTAASNASTLEGTVARKTYVLNEETVFEMDKSSSGSPFGYANSLTVKGKTKDLNGDSEAYNPGGDPVTAKIAYLAQYYNTNPDAKSYAKGTASSISISVTADPSSDTGVTETVSDRQTDIEAYYKGSIFNGKNLDKDNMTVYKMFKTLQKGTYTSDEFYVLRTTDADKLLTKENTTEKNSEGVYVATYSDNIIASFKEKDLITAADSDLTAGTVDVKVVVLRKDASGKVFIDHSNGDKVIAFTYQVAVPVKAYTAEDDFFENYGSYTEVIQTINDLKSQIEGWKQQIANLTGLNGDALDDLELVSAELEKKQQELNTYIQLYNNLMETFNELLKDTDIDENGYIATVPDGNGGTKEIVYINGKELDATPTGGKHNGKDLYTSTGDIGDGTHTYIYYVDENGVHIISIDGATQNPEIVYADSIKAMQIKITAQVTALQKELNDYRGIIPAFKKLLNITEENFDTLTGKEQLQIVYAYVQSTVIENGSLKDENGSLKTENGNLKDENGSLKDENGSLKAENGSLKNENGSLKDENGNLKTENGSLKDENGSLKAEKAEIDAALENLCAVLQAATGSYEKNRDGADGQESAADKINSITSMVQQLSSNFNANNKYLRENICEINMAYGYGHYVKYNGKYVFVIYENDSFVFYIKTSSTERQYLLTADGGATFEPAQGAEAVSLATAYDGTEGIKFMLLDDNTNGFNPYVSNPLGTYKTAMSSFINGLNGYNEKTDELIAALNAINKKSPGDDGYIEIPDNTSADSINEAIGQALESVKMKLNALELQRATYSTNMAGIAKILDEYIAGDYSGATELSDEESAAVLLAVKNAYADLELLRGNMADVNSALAALYDALFKAFGDMGIETSKEPSKGRGEETTADKIESITGMINQITNSYNALKGDYDALKQNYQSVIDSIYGEDEKTADQVTTEQIISQIEKNKQTAITEAVNEALKDADNFETQSVAVQQSIAGVIDDILEGKEVDASALDPALQTKLEEVKNMKAELNGMQNNSEAYAGFLETLRSALSLDETADAAKILEGIQSLKDQVAALTEQLSEKSDELSEKTAQLAEKTETISKIQTKLSTTADGDELVALVGTGDGDTTEAYNKGYEEGQKVASGNAAETYNKGYKEGYADGQKAASSNNSDSGYQTGYNAGYNAGYVAGTQTSNNNSNNSASSVQIANLTNQVTTLTKENATLASENQSLSDGIDNLYEQVSDAGVFASVLSLNGSSSSKVNKLQKIGSAISNLIDNNKDTATENKSLQSQNQKLTDENKILLGSNEKLSTKNKSLTSANNKLSTSEKKLKTQVSSLQSQNQKLTDENKILLGSNEKLSTKNKTLTAANNKLSASEKTLETQISSLQSQVESLKKNNSTLSTTASRYNTATVVANNGYTSNTASVKPSSNTNTTESATGTEETEDKSKASDTETEKNKQPDSDDEAIESAEIIQNTALDVGAGTERQLGEVFETMLPISTTMASSQNASTMLNVLENGGVMDIITNAKETSLATEEQKNDALTIVNWYMNNLEELGNLGSPEIKEAATDPAKSVTFDVLTSIDVIPSDEQQKAIDNQQDVNLTVSSFEIEDGALYLIVHESDLRMGTFDVLLTRAYGNEIDIKVPDLSPVTLTKITINDVNSISSASTEISTEETPQEIQDNDKENSGFRIVMYILLFVAVGSVGVLFVLAKRRNGGFKRK